MLDLKTVKNITISEGSVTKITDSSGVVLWQKETGSSASLDIDLNNQWIESTKKLDGYKVYMSNSNHNVNNGYASMKFKFKGKPDFKIWINSYAESNYDYTIAWDMDKDYPTSNPSFSLPGAKASTNGKQYNPNSITAFTEVDYPNDGGEHFVVVTYRKDSSSASYDDRGYVAIKLTLLSTTWVVSATEFVKKDDKYYQRINEVGTYEGGFTANTGNYKEGNELTVTYKQGSADDFMVNDGKLYYKKYAYVTPKDQEINTGDYIQGDYIGEAIPAMKVTYVDGSEKTFYNLTSIESDTDTNKANAKSVEIYDGVNNIGQEAFKSCGKLTSVILPDSLTSIGNNVFHACSSLTSVTIPDSVTSIGNNAFNSCSSLTSITIPTGVTRIEYSTFYGCENLTSVTILSGVTYIGYQAFGACKSLSSVTIPNSVTKIENSAFELCKRLTGVTIPDSVTSIGDYAFNACSSLTSITIPTGVTRIEKSTFSNCSSLLSVTIPSGVTFIGYRAFGACKSLSSVTIPNSVTRIANSAFEFCSNLENIIIPSGVTRIENSTFSNCSSLSSVTIPNSVTKIENSAFELCKRLTGVTIPDSVTSIGDYAFNACSSLTSITIPTGVTRIEKSTFSNCSSLSSITIPNSVTYIENLAFIKCSSLATVTIENSTSKLAYNTDAFANIPSTAKLYVPSNLLADYQSDSSWTYAFKGGIYAIPS